MYAAVGWLYANYHGYPFYLFPLSQKESIQLKAKPSNTLNHSTKSNHLTYSQAQISTNAQPNLINITLSIYANATKKNASEGNFKLADALTLLTNLLTALASYQDPRKNRDPSIHSFPFYQI